MAMISQHSKCGLCGGPIGAEPATGFRHFARNQKDPLVVFSDAPFHRRCFSEHPLRERVLSRLEERERKLKTRVCAVCGKDVASDWYTTDHLVDDPRHPLFRFNYVHFHRAHLHLWSEYAEFVRLVGDFVRSGQYEGPPILPESASSPPST